MISEYRQHFGQFQTAINREDYLFRAGHKNKRELAYLYGEYSDLFRLSTVEELRARLNEVSESRETERTSIGRLIAFALEQNLSARVMEISAEIESYKTDSKIDWEEKRISFSQAEMLLTNEVDRKRRHDLFARLAGAVSVSQDLQAEYFEKLHQGARELGYENLLAMSGELRGFEFARLTNEAAQILAKTESCYVSALAPMIVRDAGVSFDEAVEADLPLLRNYSRFDAFFVREQMKRIYRELFSNLGFRTEQQSNLEIDSSARPGKQPQAFCSPVRIPDEIKLVVNLNGGQVNYREFLRASGQSQLYAWTSRNLFPEFRIGGDSGVVEAWGMLFENLLLDESWLIGTLGFVENAEFRHALSVLRLMSIRHQAARLIYETEFHAEKLTGKAAPRYAELMTDAVRVGFDESGHWRGLSGDLRPAAILRAAAFEAQMRDYLKTQFGSRWWTSRKAGETLIDLWNTGQRYSVEELAAMIGLGKLDFDYLTRELIEQLSV